ncbi:MAG: dipeptide epimerase, partial [Deltaproteobacteria bacterium]|nr:dipeptide epimerase [Deltaproteobacteria bacterium]
MIVLPRSLTLPYARPFGIARWTRTRTDNVVVHVEAAGGFGIGEGAPNARYGEDLAGALATLAALPSFAPPSSLDAIEATLADMADRLEGQRAAMAALDAALCDWLARARGVSLASLLALEGAPGPGPQTSFTIGLGEADEVADALAAAAAYPLYKVKLGADEAADAATLTRLRQITAKPLRVDANEGWVDREVAIRRVDALVADGAVELVEQPLPAGHLDDVAWLRARSPLPLVADEDCVPDVDLGVLAEVYDGVNIKLDKEGGILAARRRLRSARA